jgi:glycerol-3-phosphate acyltransferase PlsX
VSSHGLRRKGHSGLNPTLTVALDAMGGDHAPSMVVAGAALGHRRYPKVKFVFFGDERKIKPLLDRRRALRAHAEIRHTEESVGQDMKLSVALRARQSSMRLAIDAVAAGEADCIVSAGDTKVLMPMAKIVLKTLPGIHRPAIASFLPTMRGESAWLDLGANLDCDAENLVQFAVMGAIFARTVLDVPEPAIGLLNVGSEDEKGREALKIAAQRLRTMALPGRFHGFIEGNDIPLGTVDVIVTDGFTGNIALKLAEGMGKLYTDFLRKTFRSSLMARLGYLMASAAFRKLRDRIDPRRYNGGMFLGLGGVCVKSHGGTDGFGFANAIGVAIDLVAQGFNEHIREELRQLDQVDPPAALAI